MSDRRDYWDEFRMWLAGRLFLLAGWVHASYWVWLDGAPRR